MTTEFTKAARKDLTQLLAFMREFYHEAGYPFDEEKARRVMAELLADPAWGRVVLLGWDGEAVGYLVVTFGYSLEYHGRDAFIDEIYLRPVHRGRGIGTAAMRLAEQICREEGVRALHLEVERDNERALRVYREQGFEDHDRFLMTKRLDPPH